MANDVGLALELASPLFPGAFLLLACLGSVCRAVVGVAGGATRMALTQHFALQRNAADIAAKEGSQETATTLVGMVSSVRLCGGRCRDPEPMAPATVAGGGLDCTFCAAEAGNSRGGVSSLCADMSPCPSTHTMQVLGMAFTSHASSSLPLVWALFVALTTLHIYCNIRAMRCLCITSLNRTRLELLLRSFLTTVRLRAVP